MWIRTPTLEVHLKSFGCKRLNLIESFWHGHCASSLYSLWPFFFVAFVIFVFLGFELHNIHAFHSRLFLLFLFKKKKKKIQKKRRKREEKCVLHYLSWIWNQGWPIYLYITCLCFLFSLDELIWLHFTSLSFVVHVVWEDVYSFWSHDLDLEVTCFWLSDLKLLRKT